MKELILYLQNVPHLIHKFSGFVYETDFFENHEWFLIKFLPVQSQLWIF